MKQKMMGVLLCFLFLLTINSVAAENIDKTMTKAVLAEQIFAFKPVVEGTTVTDASFDTTWRKNAETVGDAVW
jgi:hypothetical protein